MSSNFKQVFHHAVACHSELLPISIKPLTKYMVIIRAWTLDLQSPYIFAINMWGLYGNVNYETWTSDCVVTCIESDDL